MPTYDADNDPMDKGLNAMIKHCEENPVRSRHHEWVAGQQAAYNNLHWRGRTLYDNLRTQYDLSHADAWFYSYNAHGTNRRVVVVESYS